MKNAVFPGSFDPITLGHEDVIRRAVPIFDEMIIAIGVNEQKKYMFSLEERIAFIKKTFADIPNIKVTTYTGLTMDYCTQINATCMVRGLRNPADFEFEKSIAQANKKLSGIDTFFLLTSPDKSYISSSIVREIIRNKGDYTVFVPNAVRL